MRKVLPVSTPGLKEYVQKILISNHVGSCVCAALLMTVFKTLGHGHTRRSGQYQEACGPLCLPVLTFHSFYERGSTDVWA